MLCTSDLIGCSTLRTQLQIHEIMDMPGPDNFEIGYASTTLVPANERKVGEISAMVVVKVRVNNMSQLCKLSTGFQEAVVTARPGIKQNEVLTYFE